MPDEDLGDVAYNGLGFGYIKTTECSQEPEYDESGTDQLYMRTTLRFNAVLSQTLRPVENGETVAEAAKRIEHMLATPRRPFTYVRDGTTLIDLPGGRDSANGPLPFGVSVREFAEMSWLISWGVVVRDSTCDDNDARKYKAPTRTVKPTFGTGVNAIDAAFASLAQNQAADRPSTGKVNGEDRAKTRTLYSGVLSNRWAESHDINPDTWLSTVTRRGTLIVDPSAGNHPDTFRGLVTPPALSKWKREAHYDVTKDGLKLNYVFVDRQLVRNVPAPATKMTGFQADNTNEPGVVRRGVLSVTLDGPPGVHPAYLANAAVRLAVGRALKQGLRPFGQPAAWIVGGGFRESLDENRNSVTLDITFYVQSPPNKPQVQAPGGVALGVAAGANFLDRLFVDLPAAALADPGRFIGADGGRPGVLGLIEGAAQGAFDDAINGGAAVIAGPPRVAQQGPGADPAAAPVAAAVPGARFGPPGPIGAWIGAELEGTAPGRAVAPSTRGAAGWLTLVSAALKDPCLETAVKAAAAGAESPALGAASVNVVETLPVSWVETIYDDYNGAYTEFSCRAVWKHSSGKKCLANSAGLDPSTGLPYPNPVVEYHAPTMTLTVELTATKVGGEPDLPDVQAVDDNLCYEDSALTLCTPNMLGDNGSSAEVSYALVAHYTATNPAAVQTKPPMPNFLKPIAKFLFAKAAAAGGPGWYNYADGGHANFWYPTPPVASGSLGGELTGGAAAAGSLGGVLSAGVVAGLMGNVIGNVAQNYSPNPGGTASPPPPATNNDPFNINDLPFGLITTGSFDPTTGYQPNPGG